MDPGMFYHFIEILPFQSPRRQARRGAQHQHNDTNAAQNNDQRRGGQHGLDGIPGRKIMGSHQGTHGTEKGI